MIERGQCIGLAGADVIHPRGKSRNRTQENAEQHPTDDYPNTHRTHRRQQKRGVEVRNLNQTAQNKKGQDWQQQHRANRAADDKPHRWPPFDLYVALHGPMRMPTPWTVSIASSQSTAANFARTLRKWLSIVRSLTWMLVP